MPKRLINEGVLVVRNGRRVRPEIGKLFDLTTDEIAQLEAVRPSAITFCPKITPSGVLRYLARVRRGS